MKLNHTENKNGTNTALTVAWIVGISSITSFIVVVGISYRLKLPLSPGIDGLAALGTLLGTIAVLGGVVTALISLFTLASINERIAIAAKNENANWSKELDKRWDRYSYALEKYWEAVNEQKIELAGRLMEEAYQLSDKRLSVASHTMFSLYWSVTADWAWDQLDSTHMRALRGHDANFTLITYGNSTSSSSKNYSDLCIKWGERALSAKDMPEQSRLHLQLAQVYALKEEYQNTINHINKSLELDPNQELSHSEIWALVLWNWKDDERISNIFKKLQYQCHQLKEEQLENWVKEQAYATMVPIVGLQRDPFALIQLTVYAVGLRHPSDDSDGWVVKHKWTQYPQGQNDTWSLTEAVAFINKQFYTIGRF